MIALGLLASHMVGDYVFQTRWQANGKLDDWALRTRHVLAYCLAFGWVPLLDVPADRLAFFFVGLYGLHFLTDSRRFHSTLGDLVGWWTLSKLDRRLLWEEQVHEPYEEPRQPVPDEWLAAPTPNPWPSLPLAIDQSLHVAQIALLGLLLT